MSESWHLRKELSIGTILSLLTLSFGGVFAFASLQADVQNVKEATESKVSRDQVARIEVRQQELKEDVEAIKRKVEILPAIQSEIKSLVRELEREREERRNQ